MKEAEKKEYTLYDPEGVGLYTTTNALAVSGDGDSVYFTEDADGTVYIKDLDGNVIIDNAKNTIGLLDDYYLEYINNNDKRVVWDIASGKAIYETEEGRLSKVDNGYWYCKEGDDTITLISPYGIVEHIDGIEVSSNFFAHEKDNNRHVIKTSDGSYFDEFNKTDNTNLLGFIKVDTGEKTALLDTRTGSEYFEGCDNIFAGKNGLVVVLRDKKWTCYKMN